MYVKRGLRGCRPTLGFHAFRVEPDSSAGTMVPLLTAVMADSSAACWSTNRGVGILIKQYWQEGCVVIPVAAASAALVRRV